jgi:hypothetical protein
VSARDIIAELPKLSEAEMRLVRQRLVELAAENSEIAACEAAALEAAITLDRMEADDVGAKSR